jgi:hypothetical protein
VSNVKLSHDVDFSAVIVDGSRIYPNNYQLKINMVTATDNSVHQNVAIQRILVFLTEVFDGSVFCYAENPLVAKLNNIAKESNIILFPEEPFDQIIGLVLFNKLSAIVEENLEIDSLIIGSEFAPDLRYTIEDFQEFPYDETKIEIPWWERSDLSTTDNRKRLKTLKSWDDINLAWDSQKNSKEDLEFILELEDNGSNPNVIVLEGGASNEQ